MDHPENNTNSFQFWEDIYLADDTGWDLGGVTPAIESIAKALTPGKVCILGCGRGYDAVMFAKKGFEVTAVDFAPSAIKSVKSLAKKADVTIQAIQDDIFSLIPKYENMFDYIIEQTCFCAINPDQRYEYEHLVKKLLKSGGKLIGLWFPLDKTIEEGGPPWAVKIKEVKSIFKNGWTIEKEGFLDLSISSRKGREKLIIFKKK
ncbi:MAG: methyltransferase domain-containing protein [Fidelibacterota bacterium]